MKYLSILISILFSCQCWGQRPHNNPANKIIFYGNGAFAIPMDTAYKYRDILKYYFNIGVPWIDTVKPKVLYGYAGIQKDQPIDSSKYYYNQFIKYNRLMNETTGKKSMRYLDSAEKYSKLLLKNK